MNLITAIRLSCIIVTRVETTLHSNVLSTFNVFQKLSVDRECHCSRSYVAFEENSVPRINEALMRKRCTLPLYRPFLCMYYKYVLRDQVQTHLIDIIYEKSHLQGSDNNCERAWARNASSYRNEARYIIIMYNNECINKRRLTINLQGSNLNYYV